MKLTIKSLPEEILEKIFFHLSPYREYDNVSLVCKQWRRVIAGVSLQLKRKFEESFEFKKLIWTEARINDDHQQANGFFMSPRLLHSLCYHDDTRGVYVFGGRSVGSQSAGFNDLWRLNMQTKKWERLIMRGDIPQPKFGCSLESHKNHLILYGGRSMPRVAPFVLYQPDYCSDELHIFDAQDNKWELKPTIQDAPPPLYLHGTCIVTNQSDDDDGCMFMFGGIKERGGGDSAEMWCLDLPRYNWWRPTIIGQQPEARHMHTQAAVKNEYTYSGAVILVGGCTTDNRILTDAWMLVRSGFREWTSTPILIQPGPNDFVPPISIFKRGGVKVGQNLVFFGAAPLNKVAATKRRIKQFCPYGNEDKPSDFHRTCTVMRMNRNPLCIYVLNLESMISENVLSWRSSLSDDGKFIHDSMLGPDRPNYHIAVAARGEIVIHGDFPLETPQIIERTIRQSHNFLHAQGTNKWTPLYFISPELT